MINNQNHPLDWVVRLCGAAAAIHGAIWLTLWLTGVAGSWSADGTSIILKTNMALGMTMGGAALFMLSVPAHSSVLRLIAGFLAVLLILIGGLTLGEHLFGIDLGIDQLLATEKPGAVATASPNRIGLHGSTSLALLGAGLLMLSARQRRWAPYFGLAVCVTNLMPLIGFLYGIVEFYSKRVTVIAFPTVLTLLALGSGLVIGVRETGPFAAFWRPNPGGALLRRLLPAMVLIPLALGFVKVQAEQSGYLDSAGSTGLLVIALIVIFTAVVGMNGMHLSRIEAARAAAEEALVRNVEELSRSNRDLEQFAYIASHDLQEPLRAVNAFLKLLKERYGPKLDDKAREFIGYSVDGATRMSELIKALMEYSRADRMGGEPEPVDANRPLWKALENLFAGIKEAEATVTCDDLPAIRANPTQLTQLFQNLIGNAIKFRSPVRPCLVHIGARRQDGAWIFSIRDNGIGIAPEQFERIFVIFQRLHARDKYPGTGIGLAICKKIVEHHGGRIWVESAPEEGSTFNFMLG